MDTTYDVASRYLAKKAGPPLVYWLTGVGEAHLPCSELIDSNLVLPNLPQRVCDLVAKLRDLTRGGVPCAGLVEFQIRPDPNMCGRLLIAGGMIYEAVKPTDLPGDRFGLIAIVVNLTGRGNSGHHTAVGDAVWTLRPREIDVESLDAEAVMDQVESGAAPMELLALIPLMKNGGEEATMKRWHGLVSAEPDLRRRGDCALALVFAGAVGLRRQWEKLVEGLSVIESPVVADWKRESRNEGRNEGMIQARIEDVLDLLGQRGPVPPDLEAKIRAGDDHEQLRSWLRMAAAATSIDRFRLDTNL